MRRALLFFALLRAGCGPSENVETLYRISLLDENARIHVATFDATESRAYNQQNCRQVQELFQAQPGVWTRFWCEAGRYGR